MFERSVATLLAAALPGNTTQGKGQIIDTNPQKWNK